MKGMVGIAIVLLFVGVAYVLINRPSVAPKTITGPSTSNAIFGALGSIGSNLINTFSMSGSKVGAPSAVNGSVSSSSDAVYKPGDSFDDYASGLFGPGINSDGTGAYV